MRASPLLLLGLLGCGGSETFMIVTIDSVPAVHDVAKVQVDLDNDGQTRGDSFSTTNLDFPATFSISAGARTGNLDITVSAFDEEGLLVGRGKTTTMLELPTAALTLDSADFVINTDFADDQFPSGDFESHGVQLGSAPDGTWTATYRDACNDPCNMLARRFDVTGVPVDSALAAGTNGFPVSTELSDGFFTTPTTASTSAGTVVLWNFEDVAPSTEKGIACRAIDTAGNGVGNQKTIATELGTAFAVSATPLGAATFAVAWNSTNPDNVTKGAIVDTQCGVSGLATISTVPGTLGAIRPSIATNGDRVLYSWTLDDTARFRVTTNTNAGVTGDLLLITQTATENVEFTHATKLGTGFGVFVRWAAVPTTAPGKIELYRISNAGVVQGTPVLITNKTSSSFDSAQAFSVTTRAEDGLMLVVWHTCQAFADDSGCGVFGRFVGSDGNPIGEEFSVPTTTQMDQTDPSVIALPGAFAAMWKDESLQAPDIAGSAVRGRVIYSTTTGGGPSSKPEPRTVFPTIEL